jgi:hypothetical protein
MVFASLSATSGPPPSTPIAPLGFLASRAIGVRARTITRSGVISCASRAMPRSPKLPRAVHATVNVPMTD